MAPAVQGGPQPHRASEQSQTSGKEDQAFVQATTSKVMLSAGDFKVSEKVSGVSAQLYAVFCL